MSRERSGAPLRLGGSARPCSAPLAGGPAQFAATGFGCGAGLEMGAAESDHRDTRIATGDSAGGGRLAVERLESEAGTGAQRFARGAAPVAAGASAISARD